MSIPRPGIPQDGTLELQRKIAELERKERAHDEYLAAMRAMTEYAAVIRRRLALGQLNEDRRYWIGWLSAVREWTAAIADQGRQRNRRQDEEWFRHQDAVIRRHTHPDEGG